MIQITFPDNSVKEFTEGVTPIDIAHSISSQLARDIVAATVNGNQWDDNNIDSYNQYTKIINKVSPHQQGSICESERNQVIENRHKFFIEMCDFYNARKVA